MNNITLDIESFSSVDIGKSGVYRYAESPDFEILLFACSVDGQPVKIYDLANGEKVPDEILKALTDEKIIKHSFNASFERICLSRYLGLPPGTYLSPEGWHCDMVWAATLGLPQSLEGVGAILGLEKQKLTEGKDLIRYFCKPCTPTQSNSGRTRNLPHHAPDKWSLFKSYNLRDVETEMEIQKRLSKFPVPDFVWEEYIIDQQINDRGVLVDMELVYQAITMDHRSREELTKAMKEFTALENPNSVQQMKEWLAENGLMTESLDKKAVAELMKNAPPELCRVLSLRQQLAKSAVKKYQAMQNAVCADNRARGLFRFYGANRTGRFSSKNIQLQNLCRNSMSDLDEARALVRSGNYDAVSMLYEDVPDTLSQLVRTAFIPPEGKLFYVADFSAIEARVIAWLAGEKWRMELFKNGGDIYCMSASQMFKVPVEKHGVNGHLRQKGKVAELACGYGGGIGALKAMGALDMGLKEEELQPLVTAWRNSNPNIVKFWWAVDRAVMKAIIDRTTTETHGLTFTCRSGMLFITLPSGRKLAYVKPRIGMNQFGGESVTYEGIGATKKWERIESYGPKFVENIVQAISRDILCYAMKTLRHCSIVMHIHDEVVIEADPRMSLDAVCEQMGRTPPWADGLILDAAGYVTEFYKKD
ncbi:DNA polymerase [uncultured Ruminobacter sp.]|uniref:DNA polymerase n=1 Tax=uncultured Ruminobacter sp. TaxID=538947 RepID=UPI0025DA391B|nr:DNA polymerase [uncultured Ruminobacter sp.]